jgi:hypothetical protein
MITIERATALLAPAPGPTPWYLAASAAREIDSQWGKLTWSDADGTCLLRDPVGNTRLIVGFYAFVARLGARRIMVWYQTEKPHATRDQGGGRIDFRIIDVDDLDPITDPRQTSALMKQHGLPLVMFPRSGEDREPALSLPAQIQDGLTAVGLPEDMNGLDELLFFVHRPKVRLWALCPATGTLDVMPQDWFNDGDYDFGYQWPTRAARDPETKKIVGDGIRIGVFVLDKPGRNVERWLRNRD